MSRGGTVQLHTSILGSPMTDMAPSAVAEVWGGGPDGIAS
jgi:hypothetical protein